MRKPTPDALDPHRRAAWRGFAALLLGCAVLAALGCATTTETRGIVTDTNALLLNPLRLTSPGEGGDDWQTEIARIDAFIDGNADQPVLVNALRLRQAMLVTVHQQDSLALATFDLIDPSQLPTERDKALYGVHEHLVWWFKVSTVVSFSSPQLEKASAALAGFDEVTGALPKESEIRAYLEEMRAWIALKTAISLPTGKKAEAQELLKNGLERFAGIFEPDDVAWIKTWLADNSNVGDVKGEVPRALRPRLRAPALVKAYREEARRLELSQWGDAAQTLLDAVP